MEKRTLTLNYLTCTTEELDASDRQLVELAKAACNTSFAPYSHFNVGAAIRLANGETVCGSNQEKAAFPSGICAERCTMFYANAHFPDVAPVAIAIAARNEAGQFTATPISPCGACRQVLVETQERYGRPLRVLLYSSQGTLCFDTISDLLPFQFDADAL